MFQGDYDVGNIKPKTIMIPAELESATPRLEGVCSIQLSYGTVIIKTLTELQTEVIFRTHSPLRIALCVYFFFFDYGVCAERDLNPHERYRSHGLKPCASAYSAIHAYKNILKRGETPLQLSHEPHCLSHHQRIWRKR